MQTLIKNNLEIRNIKLKKSIYVNYKTNRLMKRTTIFILFFLLTSMLSAQTSKITGSWLITKVETQENTKHPYFITDFNKDGSMIVMGTIPAGTWRYDKKKDIIVMTSKLNKDFDGEIKIEKLTDDNMILVNDKTRMYYSKIDPSKVVIDNKKADIFGTWAGESEEFGKVFLDFFAPDSLTIVITDEGSEQTNKCDWIYDTDDKTIIVMGFSHLLKGKLKLTKTNNEKLSFEKDGNIVLTVTKVKSERVKIEKLTFDYDDFPDESNDEEKLPWRDFDNMIDYLSGVKKIIYHHGKLLNDVNTFEYKTYYSMITVDNNKPSVRFTNFEIDNANQYSERYKGGMSETYNYFFPLNDLMPYRVIGHQKVTVAAGTFDCTVVEGLDGDEKIKLWMIDDKPGIYAKIIRQGDNFGTMTLTVDELMTIE